MSAARASLAFALLAVRPAVAEPAGGKVVEEVVAVVRSPAASQAGIITLTRLEEETRVQLVSRGEVAAARAPLGPAALRAGLEWLIDQTLLHDEATRLQVFDVDRAEVLAELRRFEGRFARPEDYRAFLAAIELTEEELAATLRRMLRVRRYVDSRVSRAGQVTEADVDAWLAAHPAREAAADKEVARKAARSRLAEERTREDLQALVLDLRSRADVLVLEPFGGAG